MMHWNVKIKWWCVKAFHKLKLERLYYQIFYSPPTPQIQILNNNYGAYSQVINHKYLSFKHCNRRINSLFVMNVFICPFQNFLKAKNNRFFLFVAARWRCPDRWFGGSIFTERFKTRQHLKDRIYEIGDKRNNVWDAVVFDAGPGKGMAGRHQNERLFEHRPTTTILGGTLHETCHGRYQNQKSRNESGSRTAGCLVRHPLRKISRFIRMFETSLSVNILLLSFFRSPLLSSVDVICAVVHAVDAVLGVVASTV